MVTSIVWAAAQSRCGCARGFGSITARARVERRVRAAADSARVAPAAAASPSPCPPLTQRRGALTPRRRRPLPDPPPHRPHHPPTSSHRLRSFGSIDDDESDIVLDPPNKNIMITAVLTEKTNQTNAPAHPYRLLTLHLSFNHVSLES